MNIQNIKNFNIQGFLLKTRNQNLSFDYKKENSDNKLYILSSDIVQISFGSEYCTPANFEIKKIKNLRCPVCGKIMLNNKQIQSILDDIGSKKGHELAAVLEKYEDDSVITGDDSKEAESIYRPVKQEAVDILKELAVRYPNKNIRELFRIQRDNSMENLMPIQLKILDEYKKYALENADSDRHRKKILELCEELKDQIENRSSIKFTRKNFINNTVHSFRDREKQDKINKIVQKLPTSQNNVDAFFVKYALETKTTREAARKLVEQTTSSVEHLLPKSKNGRDVISNYIVDCQDCNLNRQNLDFCEWAENIPNFENNLQFYLQSIQTALDKKILDESYKKYIPAVIETIKKLSNDRISLSIPETKNPIEQQKILQERKAKLEELKKRIDALKYRRNAIKTEISDIENIKEYKELKKYEKIKHLTDSIEENITVIEIKIQKTEEKINKLKNGTTPVFMMQSIKGKKLSSKDIKKRKEELINRHNKILCANQKELNKLIKKSKSAKRQLELQEARTIFPDCINKEISSIDKVLAQTFHNESNIASKEKIVIEEPKILKQYNELLKKINETELQNKQIEENPSFNKEDSSDYEEYKHLQDVLKQAIILKNIEIRNKKHKKYLREIFDIAIDSLNEKIERLSKLDSVIYFQNLEYLTNSKAELRRLSKQLKNIENIKEEILKLKQRSNDLLGGKTVEEIEKQKEKLLEKKAIFEKIEKLPKLKEELKGILENLSIYNVIYVKLQDYKELTNEEYNKLVSQIA